MRLAVNPFEPAPGLHEALVAVQALSLNRGELRSFRNNLRRSTLSWLIPVNRLGARSDLDLSRPNRP
jgi:hypothetical protein